MQLTLMRTSKDIIYFMGVLLVVITTASIGLLLIYVNYAEEFRIKEGDFGRYECVKQSDDLGTLFKIFKTLFWHLYGYGETNDADLVVRNKHAASLTDDERFRLCDPLTPRSKLNDTLTAFVDRVNTSSSEFLEARSHFPTEFLGYAIVFAYDMAAIVVLLNILVAMMNNTFGEILGNANAEWKFCKGLSFCPQQCLKFPGGYV